MTALGNEGDPVVNWDPMHVLLDVSCSCSDCRELLLKHRVNHVSFFILLLFFLFRVPTVPEIVLLKHFGSSLTQRALKQNLLC